MMSQGFKVGSKWRTNRSDRIFPTDQFWLIWEIIFVNLHLYPEVYLKILFWGPLLFLIYVNDMPQAVKYDISVYGNDVSFLST